MINNTQKNCNLIQYSGLFFSDLLRNYESVNSW